MKKTYLLLIILILILFIAIVSIKRVNQKTQKVVTGNAQNTLKNQTVESNYQVKEDSQGEVSVKVTPLSLSAKKEIVFEVVLNTHSIPLEQDLKTAAVLKDESGKEYEPVSWSGGTGGHHLLGELIFSAISKDSKSITLIIKDIAGLDRTFSWDIK
jgi:hypothetical protein